MADAEIIVVGAGHNGLICAAYLARSGFDTLLLESRDSVGGCASTVEDLGARFNICNCDHTLIRAMPIIDELDLASHGLHYLVNDVSGVHAFHDQSDPWLYFHDSDATLEGLAASYPSQMEPFRRYLADAIPVAKLVIEMARIPPTSAALSRRVLRHRSPAAAARLLDWSRRSLTDVLAGYFDDWHLIMPAVSMGPTVWGVPPDLAGTGLAALAYASRTLVRTGRPVGGSGALPDALRECFEAAGGRVQCNAWVNELRVRDGSVEGVTLADGSQLDANVVIAACDPQRVFVDWIRETPPAAKKLVERWRAQPVQEGYESKVDAVLAPPSASADGSSPGPVHGRVNALAHGAAARLPAHQVGLELLGPTTVVSPSPDQLAEAHVLRLAGQVAPHPTMLFNMPSVTDPAMITSGGEHILSLEVLFTPYGLPGGWADSDEPLRWINLWAGFMTPGASDSVDRWRVMTPDRYEDEFAMHRGHTPAFAGAPLATLVGRQPELTRYRTPIEGLYLSGAATYPGAGIFGAAGRNTAAAVHHDLSSTLSRRLRPIRRQLARVVS